MYHVYTVKTPRAREAVEALKEAGIGTALYHPLSIHEQEAFTWRDDYDKLSLPVAESCDGLTFALSACPGIAREQQKYLAGNVRSVLG